MELPGRDAIAFAGNIDDLLDPAERFVQSIRAEETEINWVLATVLFTDIVGSTEKAAAAGDSAWKALLERHHETVRAILGRYRGTEIGTAGDGFLATFDGPARGVKCAQAIVDSVQPLGLEVRAGLHTGEVATIDGRSAASRYTCDSSVLSGSAAKPGTLPSRNQCLPCGGDYPLLLRSHKLGELRAWQCYVAVVAGDKQDDTLEFNALSEAVFDLGKAENELRLAAKEPRALKWAVIALHNALQGMMVCALAAGSGFATLTEGSLQKRMNWYENPTNPAPLERQRRFEELYQLVKRNEPPMIQRVDSRPLTPTKEQDESVTRLNMLRDNFIHFPAALTWMVSKEYVLGALAGATDVVKFLAFDSHNVAWSLTDPDLANLAERSIRDIEHEL